MSAAQWGQVEPIAQPIDQNTARPTSGLDDTGTAPAPAPVVMPGSAICALLFAFGAGALFAWSYATTSDRGTLTIGVLVGILGASAVGLATAGMRRGR